MLDHLLNYLSLSYINVFKLKNELENLLPVFLTLIFPHLNSQSIFAYFVTFMSTKDYLCELMDVPVGVAFHFIS